MHRFVVLAAFLLAGCSSILPASGSLDGEWRLASGTWQGDTIELRDDAPISLTVNGATAGGRSACNSYFAEVARDGGGARFTGIGGTEMGCDGPVMALETAYLSALGAVTRWQRDGDRLRLSGPGVELTYAMVVPPADAALVGTRWQLETIESSGSASNAIDFEGVSMTFAADGTVSGTAGCTTWNGRWREEGGRVVATDILVAANSCAPPDPASSAEGVVMSIVKDGFAARIEGSTLSVEPEAGIGLQFRALS
ncbi:MAG: META domain-containing protein [Chloroflexota bacterium]